MAEAKEMRLNMFICSELSLTFKKIILDPKKRQNTANFDFNWKMTIFCSFLRFLGLKKNVKRRKFLTCKRIQAHLF